MNKKGNDSQSNQPNNVNGYYDQNGNYIQNGYYDENGNYIQNGYYDQNGNFVPSGYYDQSGNFVSENDHYLDDNLTPTGYYDQHGFFIITGYYDKDGNYVEDNRYLSNNVGNQFRNSPQYDNQNNNFQGNDYNENRDFKSTNTKKASEKNPEKKKSKIGYLVAFILVFLIAATVYYFKFYNKDSKMELIDKGRLMSTSRRFHKSKMLMKILRSSLENRRLNILLRRTWKMEVRLM